ncbi:MAG: LysR family transcriptional regulator [Cohaesibacter sp.]|nr:LysR family transcriptional regulator [Cohaesibacter sp.]MCV6601498.1 LysR family transcriptional regulator [Cohaesibacter sp.]
MDIRQLHYLVALSQEKHFTRAAQVCHVTQPTLSSRIRQLEQELGVSIVRRGQRYQGLTDEGERVVAWAKRILENCNGLRDELAGLTGNLRGRITLGVIPSALPMVPKLAGALKTLHPAVQFTILSRSSSDILHQLEEGTLDAGISYLDHDKLDKSRSMWPLYQERYCLFVNRQHPLAEKETLCWAEAAQLPLCSLTPDMQFRHIVDAAFKQTGCSPSSDIESNSINNLYAFIQTGHYAAVLPENCKIQLSELEGLCAIPLIEPDITHMVGLIVQERDPLPLLLSALAQSSKDVAL